MLKQREFESIGKLNPKTSRMLLTIKPLGPWKRSSTQAHRILLEDSAEFHTMLLYVACVLPLDQEDLTGIQKVLGLNPAGSRIFWWIRFLNIANYHSLTSVPQIPVLQVHCFSTRAVTIRQIGILHIACRMFTIYCCIAIQMWLHLIYTTLHTWYSHSSYLIVTVHTWYSWISTSGHLTHL